MIGTDIGGNIIGSLRIARTLGGDVDVNVDVDNGLYVRRSLEGMPLH